jgi:hypothetical protein
MILGAAALIGFGCVGMSGEERLIQTETDIVSNATITLDNNIGTITMKGEDRTNLQVKAALSDSALTPAWDAEYIEDMSLSIRGSNALEISLSPEERGGNIVVDYTIAMPTTVSGVTVSNRTGDISIDSVAGPALLSACTGDLNAKNILGKVDAETSTGSISVRDCPAIGRLKTSTGDIIADIPSAGDGGEIIIETSTGSITLNVNPELNADIIAETSTGDVTLHTITVTGEIEDKKIDGRIGSGSDVTIRVSASTGDIAIHQL